MEPQAPYGLPKFFYDFQYISCIVFNFLINSYFFQEYLGKLNYVIKTFKPITNDLLVSKQTLINSTNDLEEKIDIVDNVSDVEKNDKQKNEQNEEKNQNVKIDETTITNATTIDEIDEVSDIDKLLEAELNKFDDD